jgi:hypothetical protein
MSTEADRTVRPGDKIEWVSPSPHRIRFGGSVPNPTPGGPAIQLTPLTTINNNLSFVPQLTESGGIAQGNQGQTVTATVKDTATPDVTFIFTCGFHTSGMISHPFKIVAATPGQAPRTLKIRATPALQWLLRKDDGTDVQIDTTP